MVIKNTLIPNGKPDNQRIVNAAQQVLDAVNAADLSHLNPTQLYITMLAVKQSMEEALPTLEGQYEVHQRQTNKS